MPIIQGGMGNISNAVLAAAVSDAGGLGTIGVGTMEPQKVEQLIKETKGRTDKPFAINIPIQVTPFLPEMVSLVIDNHIPVVSLSAGNPAPLIQKFQAHGIKVITVCASIKQSKKAEAAGADIIVAEGYEAAGINSVLETTTLALIPQIVDNIHVPVVAAGGIADGRGLAAMFMLGASGVQMGTRFIATAESPFHAQYKHQVLHAGDHETVIVGRSFGKVRRILNTAYAKKLIQAENAGMSLAEFEEMTAETYHEIGALQGKVDQGFMNSGQVAGLIADVPAVKDLLEKIMRDAREVIHQQRTCM